MVPVFPKKAGRGKERESTYAVVDALPEIEILSRAMCLASLVVLNSLDAGFVGCPVLYFGKFGADRR